MYRQPHWPTNLLKILHNDRYYTVCMHTQSNCINVLRATLNNPVQPINEQGTPASQHTLYTSSATP